MATRIRTVPLKNMDDSRPDINAQLCLLFHTGRLKKRILDTYGSPLGFELHMMFPKLWQAWPTRGEDIFHRARGEKLYAAYTWSKQMI